MITGDPFRLLAPAANWVHEKFVLALLKLAMLDPLYQVSIVFVVFFVVMTVFIVLGYLVGKDVSSESSILSDI